MPRPSTEPADAPDSPAGGPPVTINILVSFAWWLIACTLPSVVAWSMAFLFMRRVGTPAGWPVTAAGVLLSLHLRLAIITSPFLVWMFFRRLPPWRVMLGGTAAIGMIGLSCAIVPGALPLASTALAGALFIACRLWFMNPARARPDRCPDCDYDTTGLPAPRCPECGADLTPVLALAQSANPRSDHHSDTSA